MAPNGGARGVHEPHLNMQGLMRAERQYTTICAVGDDPGLVGIVINLFVTFKTLPGSPGSSLQSRKISTILERSPVNLGRITSLGRPESGTDVRS